RAAMASTHENAAGNHNENTSIAMASDDKNAVRNDNKKAAMTAEFQLKKYLLLLATLVATVTYVAGLNLPGGSWTEDTPGGQVAGESILRETYYYRYIVFYYCNAVSFAASLVVSLLLLVPNGGGYWHGSLRLIMVIDLFGLMGAYAAGSSRDPFTTVCAALMVAGLTAYVTVTFLCYIVCRFLCCKKESQDQETAANKKEESQIEDQETAALLAEHEILMVLAIFVATVAYVAGMNPPGGFWRSTKEGHHTGGDPILQGGHSGRYMSFFFFNTTAFVTSLLAIVLILDYKKLNIRAGRCGLYGSLLIAIVGLGGAYAAGSCRDPESTIYVVCLGAIYLPLQAALTKAIIFLWNQLKKAFDRVTGAILLENSKLSWIGYMCKYPRKWLAVITSFFTGSRPPPDEKENVNKACEFIQLLAILAATITYQAGLDPPGGLWLENGEGHTVGDSILLTTHPIRYKAFFYSNSVAFVASLVIIVMLQNKKLVRLHILEAAMILDLFSLMGAYAAGSSRDTSTSIYIVAMAGAVLIYVVIHIIFFTLDPRGMHKDVLDKCREVLLLLAILAASITYQAGLTPPGGFWEIDDEKHGHHAGFSILQDKYHRRYKAFFYCNAASFMASVALIILLVNPTLYKPAIECYALFVCMVGGMFGLMAAYAAGSSLHLKASIVVLVLVALVPVFGFAAYLVGSNHRDNNKQPAGEGGATQGDNVADDAAKDQIQPAQQVADGAAKDDQNQPPTTGTKSNQHKDQDNDKAKYLMLLGILAASVTYLTGLKPPGGLWRDDNDGHSAGSPILYDMDRRRYMVFFYSNSTSFMASIIVIVLLLCQILRRKRRPPHWSLHTAMVLDMLALLVAYAAGSARKWGTSRNVILLLIPIVVFLWLLFCYKNRRRNTASQKGGAPTTQNTGEHHPSAPATEH
uniref:PGG domain-containing protein n=4 Tax=Aegilops tauschii subsp. strangulata TaxID=200361 RepID=A0A453PVQ8_AEGTS